MSITYSTPGAFPTATVALFRCRCGRQAAGVGIARSSLPRGWVEAGAGDEHLCPNCAPRTESAARST